MIEFGGGGVWGGVLPMGVRGYSYEISEYGLVFASSLRGIGSGVGCRGGGIRWSIYCCRGMVDSLLGVVLSTSYVTAPVQTVVCWSRGRMRKVNRQ